METMRTFFTWALVISLSAGAVGFWLYTYEMIRGRITIRTRWKDLDADQLTAAVLTILGTGIFLMSLIGLVVIKGQA